MATKQGIRLGGAYVEITADKSKLDAALNEAQSLVKEISSGTLALGTGMTALGVAMLAPVKKAADVYAEFEKTMLLTQSVTNATETQFQQLTEKAKELGATTSWTSTQVAEGMLALGRIGFNATEIDKTIASVMDLGRALDTDVYDASNLLGSTMRQFGAGMDDAAHYADALATATNSAAISNDELQETLKYVGSAASSMGADVETVLALTMALRNTGVSASQAGTQLRSMFLKLQNPKTIEVFGEKFGADVYDAQGRLRSFVDILVDAQKKASLYGDELSVIANKVVGRLVAPGLVSLLKTDNLEELRDALYSCDGAAEKLRGNMESGVFGSLKRVESAVEAVGIQMTETLVPAITRVSERTIGLASYAKEYLATHAQFANALTEEASCAVAAGSALLTAGGVMKGVSTVAGSLTNVLKAAAAAWQQAGINIKATNAAAAAGTPTIVRYSKAMQTLRFVAAGLKTTLKGIFAGLAVAVVWEGMVQAFKLVSDYANQAANKLKEAREEHEKMLQRDIQNADELTQKREDYARKIHELVAGAGSDKPLNATERRELDKLYNELHDAGFLGNSVTPDENSPSGYRVASAGSEKAILGTMAETLYDEFIDKFNASKVDMAAIDPNRFKKGTEYTYDVAQEALKDFYKPLADALTHLSNAQIDQISRTSFFATSGSFADRARVINENMAHDITVSPVFAEEARKERDKKLTEVINDTIKSIKDKGALLEADEKVLREFLWQSGTTNPKRNAFFQSVMDDFGKGFTERVFSAMGGSNLKSALDETLGLSEAYWEDFESLKGKPYESEEDKQRREVLTAQAEADRKATFDKQTEAQDKEEEARLNKWRTNSERDLAALEKEWEDYLERLREATVAKMTEAEREAFEKEGGKWQDLLTDAERERLDSQREAFENRREALGILAANERTEATQGVAVTDIKEASKSFAEKLQGGNFANAVDAARNLDGLIAAATQNGYDITEARKAIVEDIQSAVAAMGQYTLDSKSTFGALEFMEMSGENQLDVQKSQLDQLRQLAASSRAILTELQQDQDYKEFF